MPIAIQNLGTDDTISPVAPRSPESRISLVTLGVANVAASRRFYEALGFVASKASNSEIAFFQLGGLAFGLYARAALAHDACVPDTPVGFRA